MRDKVRYLFVGFLVCFFGILQPQPGAAQQAVSPTAAVQRAAAPAAADRVQLESYIRVMKGELERSEARVDTVRAQLISLDEDIESRVDRIVTLLSSTRDAVDGSSTRIRMAKKEALAGLKKTAQYYAQQRDLRKKEMGNRYAQIEQDALARDVAALNARIETRVTQSLEIASSLVQYQEGSVTRYRNTDTDYSNESREYRKAKNDASASAKIKADLAADLRASIDKLTREKAAREAELQTTRDPQKQEQLNKDIATLRQTIDARRQQIEELVTAPKPATRPVGSKGAFELDKMLNEMTVELKSDFTKFKSLIYEFDTARTRVKTLKERLAKTTAMLDAMNSNEGEKPAASPTP